MTVFGEAPVPSPEHSLSLDLSFVTPEAIDQLRQAQHDLLFEAGRDALQKLNIAEAFSKGAQVTENARQEVAAHFDDLATEYVDNHLQTVDPSVQEHLREELVPLVIASSVNHMGDEAWHLGDQTDDGSRTVSGWGWMDMRVNGLVREYERVHAPADDPEPLPTIREDDGRREPSIPVPIIEVDDGDRGAPLKDGGKDSVPAPAGGGEDGDDDVPPNDLKELPEPDEGDHPPRTRRRLGDLALLGTVVAMDRIGRFGDRIRDRLQQGDDTDRRNRGRAALIAAGIALAGAGLIYLLERSGVHHGAITPGNHHVLPHRTPTPRTGHHKGPLPNGAKLLGPHQTEELERAWATGGDANHMLRFVSDRRGHIAFVLEGLHPDGSVINGHAVNLAQAHDLRANITLNVNGQPETLSIPMRGDRLDLSGKLARLIQRNNFSTVEIVRSHGSAEDVFSTATGNGRPISSSALQRYLTEVQKLASGQGTATARMPRFISKLRLNLF
jgi:hypothetical protein